MDKVTCDWCLNRINDTYEEDVSAIILSLEPNTYIFCDDDCLKKFILDNTWDVYVTPEGHIVD